MTFTMSIKIENGQLTGIAFSDNAQPVGVGAALQALDAAKAALLNVPVAQPQAKPETAE